MLQAVALFCEWVWNFNYFFPFLELWFFFCFIFVFYMAYRVKNLFCSKVFFYLTRSWFMGFVTWKLDWINANFWAELNFKLIRCESSFSIRRWVHIECKVALATKLLIMKFFPFIWSVVKDNNEIQFERHFKDCMIKIFFFANLTCLLVEFSYVARKDVS